MSISSTTSQGSFSATTVTPASSVANSIHKELPAVPPKIDTTPLSKKPGPIDTAFATLTSSVSSPTNATPTQRFVSGLWSPFKGNASPKPHAIERPSANFAERQRRQSRPPSVAVLPGFQENLLAQMEQLNQANVDDPKTRRVMMQKRKSIRKSIVQHAAPKDGFDWDYWANVLTDFDRMGKNRFVLVQQIRRGVPPPVRGTLWQLLSESHQANILAPGTRYVDLLKQPSPYDKMIQRDLPRTFPGHEYFKDPEGEGQEGLYNVVRAYSVYDGQVGYCQGLAFIVGPLLLNMADEDAFLVLVQLMQTYGLRGHFTPSMEGLHLRLYQFDKLIAEFLPHISGHLQRRGIDATMYASQWFMTLFAYKFPLDLVFRIYDLLFVEGVQVVLKFALALLKRNEKYLLQLDFEPLLDFLKNGLLDSYKGEDALLIHDAMQWDLPKRRMAQLEKEHKQQVAKEEQDARTIQTLQQEQVRLKQQVDEKQEIHDHMAREQQELRDQWQASRMHLDRMKEDQITLQTVVDTLQHEVEILPLRIEEQHKAEFDGLFAENSRLTNKNVHLEDQLAQLEAHLIDFKMRYAQNENDCTQLSKRLYELKKIIDQ
ncbi:TBC-domain-containing protein [Hesseltinella vesiculosa]|uniref:TBC-domain-containing protein n=1 Tax=Hesseltinella vesiculosa TaxID=101127 RepID=A0A1X2G3F2_9FUNG|nr:TBC-domain-containing protein [Hesseltinella vesiculosa]